MDTHDFATVSDRQEPRCPRRLDNQESGSLICILSDLCNGVCGRAGGSGGAFVVTSDFSVWASLLCDGAGASVWQRAHGGAIFLHFPVSFEPVLPHTHKHARGLSLLWLRWSHHDFQILAATPHLLHHRLLWLILIGIVKTSARVTHLQPLRIRVCRSQNTRSSLPPLPQTIR